MNEQAINIGDYKLREKFGIQGLVLGLDFLLDEKNFNLNRMDDQDEGLPAFVNRLENWLNSIRIVLPRMRSGDYETVADEIVKLIERVEKSERILKQGLQLRETFGKSGKKMEFDYSSIREARTGLVDYLKDFKIYLNSLLHKIN